jgi:uncharacterized protein (DUF58 family)
MTVPRYLNAVLTLIAALLTVITFRTVPAIQAAGAPEAQAPESPRGRAILAIGNEGAVSRLLVWDEATSTLYEYGTNGKVRTKWTLKAPGEPLNRGRP